MLSRNSANAATKSLSLEDGDLTGLIKLNSRLLSTKASQERRKHDSRKDVGRLCCEAHKYDGEIHCDSLP